MNKNHWGGHRKGAGRTPLNESEKKKGVKIYITEKIKNEIVKHGKGTSFSDKAAEIIKCELANRKENY